MAHAVLSKGSLITFFLVTSCSTLQAQNPPQNPQSAPATQTFTIAGVAVSSTSGAPLAGTRVSIFETRNPRNAQWMITGADGRFAFANVAAGKYSLRGARRGFIPTVYDQHGQFSTAIVTGAGVDTENLILRVVPMAAITGKVFDESGEPVRNAQMRLYRENRNFGFSQVNAAGYAQTDDQGSYEFAPIAPGIYFVAATGRPWYAVHALSRQIGGDSFADPSLDVAYPTTFYSGTTEAEVATPIPVKGGDRVQIDLHLNPVPSLHLRFTSASDKPGGNRNPVLQKRIFDTVEGVGSDGSSCNQDGVCELLGVPAGKYTVSLRPSAPGSEPGQSSEMALTEDTRELDFSGGEALGSLKLSVKVAGEERLPPTLSILVRDARLRVVAAQTVDEKGEAHFNDLAPGKYSLVGVTPNRQFAVVQISTPDAKGSSSSNFTVTSGVSLRLSALLAGANTRIEGFVQRSGKPAPGMMVVLVPADPEAHVELFRRDQSDLDGSFVLPFVVPGAYSVIAIEDGWTLDWSTPAVLARYAPHGENITVGSESKEPIHLPDPVEVQPR